MTLLLDFESRSRADLSAAGGRRYWGHPSTEALCCVMYETKSDRWHTWIQGDPCPAMFAQANGDVAAHNMTGFDRFAIARLGWPQLQPDKWIDTSELARTAGLPGTLDALGTLWFGVAKQKEESTFTKKLSAVRRPKDITPAEWRTLTPQQKREQGKQPDVDYQTLARVVAYCRSDVEIMRIAWDRLKLWLGVEPSLVWADRCVNDRGVHFDSHLARSLIACEISTSDSIARRTAALFEVSQEDCLAAARSVKSFCEITGAPNAQKQTVEALDHPLALVRRATATIAKGKLEAGLRRVCSDGRLRDTHRYYGAHTGRWSQKGMQLHNLTRPAKHLEDMSDDDICALARAVIAGEYAADSHEVALLLRACIVAPLGYRLAVCDFSGIEARGLAWAADDVASLDVFERHEDPYIAMASVIFGVPADTIGKGTMRTVGKIAELACGYGMGPGKFEETAEKAGIDLADHGVDAVQVVKAWRLRHRASVAFWYALENAFRVAAARRQVVPVGPFSVEPAADDDRGVWIFLPSGRPIVYADVRVHADQSCEFRSAVRGIHEHTYGGKLAENVVQAMCRDLLSDALVRVEQAGLRPVLHVHDEIVCEVPAETAERDYQELLSIMTTPPNWASGMPVNAAGFVARRYRK